MSASFVLALALHAMTVGAPVADGDQKAVRLRCSEASSSQVDFGQCLRRQAMDSEKELEAATARVLGRLARWDEDPAYVATAKATLAASRPAFIQYRRQQCSFARSMAGGAIGAASEVWRLACVYELNMRRAAMLDGLVGDLPAR